MKRLLHVVVFAGSIVVVGCSHIEGAKAEPMVEAKLSSVAIEGGQSGSQLSDARRELEMHLSLVAGGAFRPAIGDADLDRKSVV